MMRRSYTYGPSDSYSLNYFLRRVLPGEELVFDYGEQYWTKERNLRPLP